MRLTIATAAAFLLIPATLPAQACSVASYKSAEVASVAITSPQATAVETASTELSAATEKRKSAKVKKKKEKVEYMKSAAGPEPKPKKPAKKKKQ